MQEKAAVELPDGRIEIIPEELFAIVSEQQGREQNEAFLEAHKQYIDIQYLISGEETHGWKPVTDCNEVRNEYDVTNDIVFFADVPTTYVKLKPGQFCVFFPEDAHAPMISTGIVKKIVIKIKI